jgi:hypothetical protein
MNVIFKKLKDLFGLGKQKSDEYDGPVVLVESNSEVIFHKPEIEEEKPPEITIQSLREPFLKIFGQCVDEYGTSRAILFDPEEEECFIYFYDESDMKSHTTLSRDTWSTLIEYLKSLNGAQAEIGDVMYHIVLIISFSNFGERVSAIVHRLDGDCRDSVKEETKKYIRALNRLKPPTSLTNLNRKHLIDFIRKYKERAESGLFATLIKNGMVEGSVKERCMAGSRETQLPLDEMALTFGVFPRKKLTEIISQWIGMPYIDIEEESVDTELLKLAGREFCASLRVLPYRAADGEIFCAAADPMDRAIIAEVEKKFDCRAKLYLSAEEDIRALTEDLFKHIDRG